jgi:hypothetical protein
MLIPNMAPVSQIRKKAIRFDSARCIGTELRHDKRALTAQTAVQEEMRIRLGFPTPALPRARQVVQPSGADACQ